MSLMDNQWLEDESVLTLQHMALLIQLISHIIILPNLPPYIAPGYILQIAWG